MSIVPVSMTQTRMNARQIVEPVVFAERLLSREALERINMPEDDLLGLRNTATGETLYVRASRLRSWMKHRC